MRHSDVGEIEKLQALRLKLHRLEPSRPIRDLRTALAFIKERGIVLSTGRGSVPMLAEAIAGRHLRGSWMANPEVYRIYELLKRINKHSDVLSLPLILAKDTIIHISLGPAVARIADDPNRRAKAVAVLPRLARRLLDEVEQTGQIRMDRWKGSTKMAREARRRLERDLLVISRDIHTEHGYHTAVVVPWAQSKVAKTYGSQAKRLTLDDAVDKILLAAVRSAVLPPEREVRRWFVFGEHRLDLLLAAGAITRLRNGKNAWLAYSRTN